MCEEIFGPVLTIYLYDSDKWDETLLVNETSPYALTGCVWANDRNAINDATEKLTHAAGNFYIMTNQLEQLLGNNNTAVAEHVAQMIKLDLCTINPGSHNAP